MPGQDLVNARAGPILLAGITVRMLAELATRAAYQVVSLDYFGDADLRRLCPGISLSRDGKMDYAPQALVDAARDLDASSVVYSASLENHPDQVARLAQGRLLLGNPPETLFRVRDPQRVAAVLRSAGFCFPQTIWSGEKAQPESDRRWLWKPLRSGGGHSVRVWNGQSPMKEGILQEQLEGMVGSAAFIANGLEAVVVGITEQLVGNEHFRATGFRYCGNVMPPPLPLDELRSLLAEVRAIVSLLTAEFSLRGLNGLDFIWYQGRVWTIEINPRPTASLELMETAYDLRLFDAHVEAFSGWLQLPTFDLESALETAQATGKAILFAAEDVTLGDTSSWFERGIRDIPYPGDHIKQGHPICTVLATAESPRHCTQKLEQRVAEIETWLY